MLLSSTILIFFYTLDTDGILTTDIFSEGLSTRHLRKSLTFDILYYRGRFTFPPRSRYNFGLLCLNMCPNCYILSKYNSFQLRSSVWIPWVLIRLQVRDHQSRPLYASGAGLRVVGEGDSCQRVVVVLCSLVGLLRPLLNELLQGLHLQVPVQDDVPDEPRRIRFSS